MWHTQTMCTVPSLLHSYALLHRILQQALRRARLSWLWLAPLEAAIRGGAGKQGAEHSPEQLRCAVYQPATVILGTLVLAYLSFRAELFQRRAFLAWRQAGRRQPTAAGPAHQAGHAIQCRDFWLFFGVPLLALLMHIFWMSSPSTPPTSPPPSLAA